MRRIAWFLFVCLAVLVSAFPSPYAEQDSANFWDDFRLVHAATRRLRKAGVHGSRPFFESITNALSDAEKSAFSRLSEGLLPSSGLAVDDTPPPTNIPIFYKPCDGPDVEGLTQSMMQLEAVNVTLDPRHIKMKVDLRAKLQESLSMNLTHHTVVTVEGVSVGGFEMSPMVLYDKSGPICDMFDSVLGCPISKGDLHIARKVKIPGLDAVTSLPQRLYNSHVSLYEGSTLVTCLHLYLDMRSEEDRKANPLTGVTTVDLGSVPPHVDASAAPNTTVAESAPVQATPQSPDSADDHDAVSAPLSLLKSVVNLQKEASASKATPQQRQDTALLQQLQLENLQEQLKTQLDINKRQRQEYDDLKQRLQKLEPSEIDHLKSTVNELLQVQKAETEERLAQQQNAQREKDLYRQLQRMYEHYGLPTSGMPFGSLMGLAPAPLLSAPPSLSPGFGMGRLGLLSPSPDLQFLSQIDTNLATQHMSPTETLARRLAPTHLDAPAPAPAPAPAAPAPAPATSAPTTSAPTTSAPTTSAPAGVASSPALAQAQPVPQPAEATELAARSNATSESPSQIAGAHAEKAEPLQYPNPNNPNAKYGDGLNATDVNLRPRALEEVAKNTPTSADEAGIKMKERLPALYQVQDDKDLPDVSSVLASTPTYSDSDFGVSYTLTKLDDYVKKLCVPFVTLASDLSFSFCVPEHWQGLTAIVITDPFTGERGMFADKTSLSQPHQQNLPPDTTDDQYYALPRFIGMNEILLKHNYATIVVTFNADNFIASLPFFTTEIMGAFAAFVDYAGEPSMTITTGVGWGGVLAAQILERHGGCRLHGGLVIDSPLGNARWQGDYYGDLLTLFQWVSPKAYSTIMRTDNGGATHLLLESWEEVGRPYVYQALTPVMSANLSRSNSGNYVNSSFDSPRDLKMLEMLHALSLACDFSSDGAARVDRPHPQCLHNELANAIRKAALYILSFRLAFNGQDPYDNYRTMYLPEMFPHLNEEVSRKIADEVALNHQTRFLETSGLLKVPLSLMTTKKDPEIPEWQSVEYLRKQKQMCDADGLSSRIINDTETHYFGHAHTDQMGASLSTQLDVLYSVISMTRKVDDTSLTQRSWMPKPMRMVDAELASCPFQGEWYRDMDDALKKSIKSGMLRTNNKINQMLTGVDTKELSDVEKLAPNPDVMVNSTAASLNAAASSLTSAVDSAPLAASTAENAATTATSTVAGTINEAAKGSAEASTGSAQAAGEASANAKDSVESVKPDSKISSILPFISRHFYWS